MEQDPFAIIADKESHENELSLAIHRLGKVNEQAGFWNSIANNPEYGKLHRALSIIQLFKRHVSRGMTLGDLSLLLENPRWLENTTIEIVKRLLGEIPVSWTPQDTVFVLRIFPELSEQASFAIYLRISGKINLETFVRLLHNKGVDQRTKDAIILEIGFTEPYVTPPSMKRQK